MRLFSPATTELSTDQSGPTPDDVILRMIDGAGKLDSASWHFLDLVYCALLEEASRQNGHKQRCAQVSAQLEFEFMRTTPPRLSPAAEAKQYAAYRRSVRGEPHRRSPRQERRPSHGHRKTA